MKKNILHQKLALERVEFCLAQVQLYLSCDDDGSGDAMADNNDHFNCLFDHIFNDLKQLEKSLFLS